MLWELLVCFGPQLGVCERLESRFYQEREICIMHANEETRLVHEDEVVSWAMCREVKDVEPS